MRRPLEPLKELDAPGITLYRGLPNCAVQELMRAAHFLVLPTFHDTFGYVSIKSIHAATPVIATATGAQVEIVEHAHSGFLLPFANDARVGKSVWLYQQKHPEYVAQYWAAIDQVAGAICRCLQNFWEARHLYGELSSNALAKAKQDFNSNRAGERLATLYQLSMDGDLCVD